jgi:hypothetical protein
VPGYDRAFGVAFSRNPCSPVNVQRDRQNAETEKQSMFALLGRHTRHRPSIDARRLATIS